MENPTIELPKAGEYNINVPPFFIIKTKKGWKLFNPLTKVRNIAERGNALAISFKRKILSKPEIKHSSDIREQPLPKLNDFSKPDQKKLIKYMENIKNHKGEKVKTVMNKPRGRPVYMEKNAKFHGISNVSNENNPRSQRKPKMTQEERDNKKEATKQRRKEKQALLKGKKKQETPQPPQPTQLELAKAKADKLEKDYKEFLAKKAETKQKKAETKPEIDRLTTLFNYHKDLYEKTKDPIHKKQMFRIKSEIGQIHDGLRLKGSGLSEIAHSLWYGRTDLSPSIKLLLKKEGDIPIRSMEIYRNPITEVFKTVANLISLGQFNKNMKQAELDDLFHLKLVVELTNGYKTSIEKEEEIKMKQNPHTASKTEKLKVSIPEGLTLNSLMENTEKKMGKKFNAYEADINNCQNLVLNILRGNGLANEENEKFVKQNTSKLFDNTHLKPIADLGILLNRKVNIIREGGNLKSSYSNIDNMRTVARKSPEARIGAHAIYHPASAPAPEMFHSVYHPTSAPAPEMFHSVYHPALTSGEPVLHSLQHAIPMDGTGMYASGIHHHHHYHISSEDMEGGRLRGLDFLDPKKNGIANSVQKTNRDSAKFLKPIVKPLKNIGIAIGKEVVNKGLPALGTMGGLALGELASGGNPVAGGVGAAAGGAGGRALAGEINKVAGWGLGRKGRHAKGSPEALAWGRKMREARMRGKGVPPSREYDNGY